MSETCEIDGLTYRLVNKTGEAREAVGRLSLEEIVGVDTETIWRAEGARLSLVQIAPRDGEVYVFDALAIDTDVLRPVVEAARVSMIAHNARFDEAVLAGANLKPVGFVDTLRLSRAALRLESYSLAEVVRHLFGIRVDKSFQKSNWRKRPLSPQQLAYAAADARLTLCVYFELERLLREENRWEKAFEAAVLAPQSNEAGEGRKRSTPKQPLPPLSVEEKRIVLELKKWRLAQANAARVPAYMICSDKTLHHLARIKPATLDALLSVHGLGESKIERYGEDLLQALRNACDQFSSPAGSP